MLHCDKYDFHFDDCENFTICCGCYWTVSSISVSYFLSLVCWWICEASIFACGLFSLSHFCSVTARFISLSLSILLSLFAIWLTYLPFHLTALVYSTIHRTFHLYTCASWIEFASIEIQYTRICALFRSLARSLALFCFSNKT